MNKLLFIVGPTGTGKTKAAISISQTHPSILVSADSRQVYRGMDIVTGKDHPADQPLYGIDLVDPDEPISVSVWHEAVMPIIEKAWDENKLPIIVGGTGLYVKSLSGGIETMKVGINQSLREELSRLSLTELQTKLSDLDPDKFASLNHSDRHNPRRLIRAIEVASSSSLSSSPRDFEVEPTLIGLRYSSLALQEQAIRDRVLSRLDHGAIDETQSLIKKYDRSLQSLTAIGYRSLIDFLDGTINRAEMIDQWVADELAYAKRQLTWFRKQDLIWYDIDKTKEIVLAGV
jgi:tRNA dimethylallyltransferase